MAKRRRRKPTPLPQDRPMTEAEWERMMQESDARSARYGDLLETLIDHPDRDAIIDKEMGWDEADDEPPTEEELEQLRKDGFNSREEFDQWKIDTMNAAAEAVARGEVEDQEGEGDDVERLPVYQLANDVGMRCFKALGRHLKKHWSEERDDYTSEVGERIAEVHNNALVISVKIAGGHRMAQDEESLGGAIVKFRTSLDAAETCHRGLTELRDDGSLPNEIVDELLPDFAHVIEMLEAEIASMRSRTWWDQPDK